MCMDNVRRHYNFKGTVHQFYFKISLWVRFNHISDGMVGKNEPNVRQHYNFKGTVHQFYFKIGS